MGTTTALVSELPKCDFCKERNIETPAHYDGKTVFGAWAFMCAMHFTAFGSGLGLGVGQRLIVKEKDSK